MESPEVSQLVQLLGAGLAGKWVTTVITPTLKEAGEDLKGLYVRFKGKNLTAVVTHAAALTEGHSVEPVAGRILFPLLERASVDDDPSLQEVWARMLANAATGYVDVHPRFSTILANVTPREVHLLNYVYQFEQSHPKRPFVAISELSSELDTPFDQLVILLTNLESHRLWVGDLQPHLQTLEQFPEGQSIRLSTFGMAFVRACCWEPPNAMR